jgi:hypothetical protein
MEVLYSLDWDGTEANITSAIWGVLSAAYVVKDSDSFVPWFNSGNVDLTCATGTIYIAFNILEADKNRLIGFTNWMKLVLIIRRSV